MLSNQSRTWFVPWLGSVSLGAAAWLLAYLWLSVHGQTSDINELSTCYSIIAWSVSFVIFYGLWEGVSVNVLNCPARNIPPEPARSYPDLSSYGGYNQVVPVIYKTAPNEGWFSNLSSDQRQAIAELVKIGRDNLPCAALTGSKKPFTRQQWEDMRDDLVRAGLAVRVKKQVVLNPRGREMALKFASPTPQGKQ
jgi:hypothetical protein